MIVDVYWGTPEHLKDLEVGFHGDSTEDVLIPREGYCYETRGNGMTVEIIAPSGASVFFAQDAAAAQILDSIHNLEKLTFPTGPWKTLQEGMNAILSEYDYQQAGNDSL